MALSADVQRLIDDVTANRNLAQSTNQAFGVLEQQIKNLQDQVSGLQAGQTVNADDVAAIKKAADDLEATNTALQAATPANINTGGVDANGNPVTPAQPAQPGPNAPGNPSPGDVPPTAPAA